MAVFVPDPSAFYSGDRRFQGYIALTGSSEDTAPDTPHGEWDKAGLYSKRTIYVYNTGSTHFKVKVTLKPVASDTAEGIYVAPNGTDIYDGSDSSCEVTDGNHARLNIEDICHQINISCISSSAGNPSDYKIIVVGQS